MTRDAAAQDLSGLDVARKALIIARMQEWSIELEDIEYHLRATSIRSGILDWLRFSYVLRTGIRNYVTEQIEILT
jgi:homoserine dehydrogenase